MFSWPHDWFRSTCLQNRGPVTAYTGPNNSAEGGLGGSESVSDRQDQMEKQQQGQQTPRPLYIVCTGRLHVAMEAPCRSGPMPGLVP